MDYLLGLTDKPRDYEGEVMVRRKVDEYYEFVIEFDKLSTKGRKAVRQLMKSLIEMQENKQ